jgi:hypothetical protein
MILIFAKPCHLERLLAAGEEADENMSRPQDSRPAAELKCEQIKGVVGEEEELLNE